MGNHELMQRCQTIVHIAGGGRYNIDEAEGERRVCIYAANHCFNIVDSGDEGLLNVQLDMLEGWLKSL